MRSSVFVDKDPRFTSRCQLQKGWLSKLMGFATRRVDKQMMYFQVSQELDEVVPHMVHDNMSQSRFGGAVRPSLFLFAAARYYAVQKMPGVFKTLRYLVLHRSRVDCSYSRQTTWRTEPSLPKVFHCDQSGTSRWPANQNLDIVLTSRSLGDLLGNQKREWLSKRRIELQLPSRKAPPCSHTR